MIAVNRSAVLLPLRQRRRCRWSAQARTPLTASPFMNDPRTKLHGTRAAASARGRATRFASARLATTTARFSVGVTARPAGATPRTAAEPYPDADTDNSHDGGRVGTGRCPCWRLRRGGRGRARHLLLGFGALLLFRLRLRLDRNHRRGSDASECRREGAKADPGEKPVGSRSEIRSGIARHKRSICVWRIRGDSSVPRDHHCPTIHDRTYAFQQRRGLEHLQIGLVGLERVFADDGFISNGLLHGPKFALPRIDRSPGASLPRHTRLRGRHFGRRRLSGWSAGCTAA